MIHVKKKGKREETGIVSSPDDPHTLRRPPPKVYPRSSWALPPSILKDPFILVGGFFVWFSFLSFPFLSSLTLPQLYRTTHNIAITAVIPTTHFPNPPQLQLVGSPPYTVVFLFSDNFFVAISLLISPPLPINQPTL